MIIVTALASIGGTVIFRKQKQNVVLKNDELKDKNKQLINYQNDLDVEIKQVREMERKIRSVFGLKPKEATDSTSNGILGQGGFDPEVPDGSKEAEFGTVEQMDFMTNDFNEDLPLIDKIKFVEGSIKDLYKFAVDKEKDFACMPTVNPIQKGDFWFSSPFGWRIHPLTRKKQFHDGIDISAHKGTEILAPADGEIILIKNYRQLGKTVQIKHDSKYMTRYGHLNAYAKGLKVGQKVKRYDIIGYVGKTGRTTGPHLHYEIYENGKLQDPKKYILDRK